jgi:hypothetical protein
MFVEDVAQTCAVLATDNCEEASFSLGVRNQAQ